MYGRYDMPPVVHEGDVTDSRIFLMNFIKKDHQPHRPFIIYHRITKTDRNNGFRCYYDAPQRHKALLCANVSFQLASDWSFSYAQQYQFHTM